jgi:hypothetical protein
MEQPNAFRTYRREAELARAGDATVRGEVRVVSLRLGRFGAVWSRPVAVTVVRGGVPARTPVVDVTQIAVFTLLGAVLVTVLVTVLVAWVWVFLRGLKSLRKKG